MSISKPRTLYEISGLSWITCILGAGLLVLLLPSKIGLSINNLLVLSSAILVISSFGLRSFKKWAFHFTEVSLIALVCGLVYIVEASYRGEYGIFSFNTLVGTLVIIILSSALFVLIFAKRNGFKL